MHKLELPASDLRLDQRITQELEGVSRSEVSQAIKTGTIQADPDMQPRLKLKPSLKFPEPLTILMTPRNLLQRSPIQRRSPSRKISPSRSSMKMTTSSSSISQPVWSSTLARPSARHSRQRSSSAWSLVHRLGS